MAITSRSLAYKEMAQHWPIIDALMGGTATMREAGDTVLPKHEMETDATYEERRKKAVLKNMFLRTIKNMSGRAFAKPLKLGDDVPEDIVEWLENADLAGNHIHIFSSQCFKKAMSHGLHYIHVDYPQQPQGITLAEERASGARPYLRSVTVHNVLGVQTDSLGRILTARIREYYTDESDYEETQKEQIRLLYPGGYEVWRQKSDNAKEWVPVESGTTSIPVVPLVPIYTGFVAPFQAVPPLLDLAYLNIRHYQSLSDQQLCLDVARFPMLAGSGVSEDSKMVVGPKRVLLTTDPQGKFYYVEHSGAALTSGKTELDDLCEAMSLEGLQLLMPKATGRTATQSSIEFEESTSDLQDMALSMQDALENVLQLMAMWTGKKDGGSVEIRGNFVLPRQDSQEIQALVNMRQLGEISRNTLYAELKRRGVLSEEFDEDTEIERLSVEGPGMYDQQPTDQR
jgi:hypothetical protein